jgi:hypothetical protein
MVKWIGKSFVFDAFRRIMELLGIVYFFMLVVLCTLELFRDTPSLSLPLAAPMLFIMISLLLALLFSITLSIPLMFRYVFTEIKKDVGISVVLFVLLSWASVYLYGIVKDNYSELFFGGYTTIFLLISAVAMISQTFPKSVQHPMKPETTRGIIRWLRNVHQSYGVAVPVFTLLVFAGFLHIDFTARYSMYFQHESFLWILFDLWFLAPLLIIPPLFIIVSNIILVKRFFTNQWSITMRIGIVIVFSIIISAFMWFKASYSEASVVIFSLMIGYLVLVVEWALNWYDSFCTWKIKVRDR